MYKTLVINVDELWLKGKNRPMYFKAIRRHIQEVLQAYHPGEFSFDLEEQRFVAKSGLPFSQETMQALLKVPGIHSLMPARRIPVNLDDIFPVVKEELKLTGTQPCTFKVETRRSYKGFPMNSMEVSQHIGALVDNEFPHLAVDVKKPDLVIEIRILENNIYLSTRKMLGVGGLPVGTSGHLVALISGGFDSPVASYLMFKRGCRQTFVFFYAYPFVGDEVKDKLLEIIRVLGQYQRHSKLYIVPFGEMQDLISKKCKEDYRTLFFRKAMLQCAALLARQVKAEALLTGDALGQVSSQTIGNISLLDNVTPLPIFRPLVGYNKIEIIELAKKIGTHDISVIPHDDACSMFAPKHPVIRPNASYVERFDKEFPLEEHLKKCLDEAEVFDISLTGEITFGQCNEK
ncbi:MAG: tRNA 4-thiouridine(8) synthase ThiI [Candidatus Aminicenantes bacterium]|nr:tRNA 4-thiouridine(8) synthase ThiI [Candidatus Aminicenantes bacterium]NIM77850.1 tRNA 4-thiouridine(8) synthase ThiI [Candidatus Aminicenantes bacterium]NIN17162.1 tRNA 4-thiouridine(8) synthase ThiI [Candidatus Aminicenantes bacterium]NIN41055.1 tRNA 4-thiouridine(8) synthase ThiI [Candidatus Aminicenantes bacterium]NIN83860.1 tRNA 4-thiouridine(8) synthase ThiI [Candidatus Aminicenantes bacterium]